MKYALVITLVIIATVLIYRINEANSDEYFEFPDLTWDDVKDSYHPNLDEYQQMIYRNYSESLKLSDIKVYSFDLEQGDCIEDFVTTISQLTSLLPEDCHYSIVDYYTDENEDYWVVDVEVGDSSYIFKTDAIGGAYLNTESVFLEYEKLINKCAEGYEIVYPEVSNGQALDVAVTNEENLNEAIDKGFPLFRDKIEWFGDSPSLSLLITNSEPFDELALTEEYIKIYNNLIERKDGKLGINKDMFRILDIKGNGQIYLNVYGNVIETATRYDDIIYCRPEASLYIFMYAYIRLFPASNIYKVNTNTGNRKLATAEDLRNDLAQGFYTSLDM